MKNKELVFELCALMGIRTDYRNHLNAPTSISQASLEAILQARGIDTDSDDGMRAAIADLSNAQGEFRVPPVIVIREDEPVCLTIQVPVVWQDSAVEWRLTREDGQVIQGQSRFEEQSADVDETWASRTIGLTASVPVGYHWLTIKTAHDEQPGRRVRLICAPQAAYDADEEAPSEWGVSVQLYALKSTRNWGIGDFTDLAALAQGLAHSGADFVGVNPLHALYPSHPEHASPYSPASRAFINYLYIDVEAVPEYAFSVEAKTKVQSEYFQARLASLRASTYVDYSGVAFLKLVILRHLYDTFVTKELQENGERASRFHAFCEEGGAALEQLCVFYTLYAHHRKASRLGGWKNWPEALRDPDSDAVAHFADANQDTIRYYMYLQWLADEQLAAAQAAARAAGMRTGVYRDLAVGVDSNGADNWRNQKLYCSHASVGAPPDSLAPQGQDWGLPPMEPLQMQAEGYATFIEDLRENMRHCGALRLDHVMQLMRLWWTPAGRPSSEGTYVTYPLKDLLGIVALESHRQRCRVIGEDLGVVPDEIREAMPSNHIWSYKVMLFEKDAAGTLKPPEVYAQKAMATLTTHDLPTMPGFWLGRDLLLREELALFPSFELKEQSWRERINDRQGLVTALKTAGLYPDDLPDDANEIERLPEKLLLALESFLARSASRMICTQLEDWLGIESPVNVPGTSDEYPNWRRRLTEDLESILDGPLLEKHAVALDRKRHAAAANDRVLNSDSTEITN